MRKPKFITKSFALIVAITLLSMSNLMAQTQKTVIVLTYDIEVYNGCAGEYIEGTEMLEWIKWNTPVGGGYLAKYSWTGVGNISGAFYEAHGQQIVRRINMQGGNLNWTMTTVIHRNGIPMGIGHQDFHLIINPDGTIIAEIRHGKVNCLLGN